MQECVPEWEKNGGRLQKEWEKIGENVTKWPFFTGPFPPFFRRSKTFPRAPFVRIKSAHSPTEKWEILTVQHSPPQRLVRMCATRPETPFVNGCFRNLLDNFLGSFYFWNFFDEE